MTLIARTGGGGKKKLTAFNKFIVCLLVFSWAIVVIDVLGRVAKRNGTSQRR